MLPTIVANNNHEIRLLFGTQLLSCLHDIIPFLGRELSVLRKHYMDEPDHFNSSSTDTSSPTAAGSSTAAHADNLYTSGLQHKNLGDWNAARTCFEQALAAYQALPDVPQQMVANVLTSLGTLLQDMGELQAALPYLEQALALNRALWGDAHKEIATSLDNLAILYEEAGDYPTARAFYQQELDIYQQLLPPNHPELEVLRTLIADLPPA